MMPRHFGSLGALLCLIGSAASAAPEARFAASCQGSETVQVGDHAPQTAPFAVAFSADLPRRQVCYGKCKREDVYQIANAASDPIRFADLNIAGQMRRITYSRAESRLTDDQETSVGPIRIIRHAVATCQPAAYREPPDH